MRWAVNIWLVFHMAAIIVAPAAVSPSSDLIQSVWNLFQPYLEILYLNHGYHFFAPEPGDSTLLAFEAERPMGRSSVAGSPTARSCRACCITVISC